MMALQCPKHVTFCCAITLQADNCLVLVMGCYKIMQILCSTLTLFIVLNNLKYKIFACSRFSGNENSCHEATKKEEIFTAKLKILL